MSNVSDYLAAKVLDHLLGKTTYTSPSPIYMALFTTMPTSAGTGGTEVTGGAYARVAYTNNTTNFPNATAGSGATKSNNTAITFPTASAGWGTIIGMGIYDASSGGNLLWFGLLTVQKTINTSDQPSWPIGELDFVLQ